MKLVNGAKLTKEQRREVLCSFVHRHLDTTSKGDADFLAKHAFYITNEGRLSRKHKWCEPDYVAFNA